MFRATSNTNNNKRAQLAKVNDAVNKATQISFCKEHGVNTRLRFPVNTDCSTLQCFADKFTLTLDESQFKGLDVLFRIDVKMDIKACTHLDVSLTLKVGKNQCFEIPACRQGPEDKIVSFVFGDTVFKNLDGFPLFALPFYTYEVSITSNVRPAVVYLLGRYLNDDSRRFLASKQMSLVYSYTKECEVVTLGDKINTSQCIIEPDELPCGAISLSFPSDHQNLFNIDEIVVWANGTELTVLLAGHDCILGEAGWLILEEMLSAHMLAAVTLELQVFPPLVPDSRVLVKFECRRIFVIQDGLLGIS